MKRKSISIKKRNMIAGYLFILPWFFGFCAFASYPLIKTFEISFSRITRLQGAETEFVGWANYLRAFTFDVNFLPMFYEIIRGTLASMALIVIFSLFAAILLNTNIRGRGLFRGIFFLPLVLGTGLIMSTLISYGITNNVMLGVPYNLVGYFGPYAMMIIMNLFNSLATVIWRSSVQIVLFLSALQGVNERLYEAAKCDGATSWQMFCKITFPMVQPMLLVNVVFTIIDSFSDSRSAIVEYIYRQAFVASDFGYSAALGLIYFLFVLLIVLVAYFIINRRVFYAGE